MVPGRQGLRGVVPDRMHGSGAPMTMPASRPLFPALSATRHRKGRIHIKQVFFASAVAACGASMSEYPIP